MRRPPYRLLAALILGLGLVACSPKPAQKTASGPTTIRFATDWKAEAEQGGFYAALAAGEYEKRGLKVNILPGGPGSNVPQLLATGAADLGVGSNSFVAMNIAENHVPVRAVKGHPFLLSDASLTGVWVWLKGKYGFDDSQVRKYTFNSGPFIENKGAIQQGYVTSEPYVVEKEGHFKPKVFVLSDEGYPGYADLVLAPQALIDANPKAVQAFVEATAAGWALYLHGDPKAADALILKDNPEMTEDILAQARDKMRSYAIVEGQEKAPIGAMSAARWQALSDILQKAGVLKAGTHVEDAYTLAFAPK